MPFVHNWPKTKRLATEMPYLCEQQFCERYAVEKAVNYAELKTKPGTFKETGRHYWCGTHRRPGTVKHQDGTVDPSDFESISDTDDYLAEDD